jgi:hypothetical protein
LPSGFGQKAALETGELQTGFLEIRFPTIHIYEVRSTEIAPLKVRARQIAV